ncbi:unnamed protein product [Trichogramma brassicae]|uniref:Uncharacterized protein n=1 Tax=Trichogramma brassicae TaxID=86971 RepID=A0A6H5IC09_9HYME|nr:unnamed protein product [Trichogramma brassicae]
MYTIPEDEIVVIEHLPGRRVHLQDFFWTGAEDAPPWLDPENTLTLYQTHTVHHTATVYVPEEPSKVSVGGGSGAGVDQQGATRPIDCASCIDPTPTIFDEVDQNVGVLVSEDPGQRRLPPPTTASNGDENSENETNSTMMPTTTTTTTTIVAHHQWKTSHLLHMRSVPMRKSKRTIPIIEARDFEELALNPVVIMSNETASRQMRASSSSSAVDVGLVQVRMQNTSRLESGATKLIYTVHLGGKPVPAETAAKDMALLSPQEVALELGTPVLISSEPFLKESRPMALSRQRDVWVLIGAASAAFFLLAVLLAGLFIYTKRKRTQSAVNNSRSNGRAALTRSHKDEETYAPTTSGIDNTAYTSETDGRTEVTSVHVRRATPGSQDTLEATRELYSENELEIERLRTASTATVAAATATRSVGNDIVDDGGHRVTHWDSARDRRQRSATQKGIQRQTSQTKEREGPKLQQRPFSATDSIDSIGAPPGLERVQSFESLEGKGFGESTAVTAEATGSPHSYLSMPACKQFPNMRSVEPLSKLLEPVVLAKNLDEMHSSERRASNYETNDVEGYFSRAQSETKDPGVLGPIVWDLKKRRAAVDGNGDHAAVGPSSSLPSEARRPPEGTLGRTRRRINEFIEDSIGIFGARDSRQQQQPQQQPQQFRHVQQHERAIVNGGRGVAPQSTRTTTSSRTHCHAVQYTESRGKSAHSSSCSNSGSGREQQSRFEPATYFFAPARRRCRRRCDRQPPPSPATPQRGRGVRRRRRRRCCCSSSSGRRRYPGDGPASGATPARRLGLKTIERRPVPSAKRAGGRGRSGARRRRSAESRGSRDSPHRRHQEGAGKVLLRMRRIYRNKGPRHLVEKELAMTRRDREASSFEIIRAFVSSYMCILYKVSGIAATASAAHHVYIMYSYIIYTQCVCEKKRVSRAWGRCCWPIREPTYTHTHANTHRRDYIGNNIRGLREIQRRRLLSACSGKMADSSLSSSSSSSSSSCSVALRLNNDNNASAQTTAASSSSSSCNTTAAASAANNNPSNDLTRAAAALAGKSIVVSQNFSGIKMQQQQQQQHNRIQDDAKLSIASAVVLVERTDRQSMIKNRVKNMSIASAGSASASAGGVVANNNSVLNSSGGKNNNVKKDLVLLKDKLNCSVVIADDLKRMTPKKASGQNNKANQDVLVDNDDDDSGFGSKPATPPRSESDSNSRSGSSSPVVASPVGVAAAAAKKKSERDDCSGSSDRFV